MIYDKIATLLHIVDVSRQWPELKSIHDSAMADLRQLANESAPKAEPVVVTPAAGPPNSALQHPDGRIESLPERQPEPKGPRAVPARPEAAMTPPQPGEPDFRRYLTSRSDKTETNYSTVEPTARPDLSSDPVERKI